LKTIREEALTQHLRASIRLASIRDDWADAMLAEVEGWKQSDAARQAELLARHRADLARATDRLNRLLDVFIDGTITKDDFTSHKERLVQEKATLADSVARLEGHGANRFKPLTDFITASRQAKYDAETEDLEELRNWHKKTGSNLLLAAAILSGGGVSGSADGQATETGDIQSAAQSPSLTAAAALSPTDGLRGGSAARSPISADTGKRVESPRIEENKAISRPSTDGVTVTAAESGDWSEFIPILPADVASLSGGSQAAGGQAVTVFRSLGSKTDPVLHVRFPAPWSVVVRNHKESPPSLGSSGAATREDAGWRRLLALVRTSVLGDE
jgi:hypothetical protein